MKILYSWLQDFIHLRETPELLSERLTSSGLEVEHIGSPTHLKDKHLVLGTIQKTYPHSTHKSLLIAEVSVRESSQSKKSSTSVRKKSSTSFSTPRLSIVCSVEDLVPGRQVIVALPGALLRSSAGREDTRIYSNIWQSIK